MSFREKILRYGVYLIILLQIGVIGLLAHHVELKNKYKNMVAMQAYDYENIPNQHFIFSEENKRVPDPYDQDLQTFYFPLDQKNYTENASNPKNLGYVPKNTINTDNLHERFEYATATPADTYRIITLGDSFTFGLYVDTADNFSEKLEDLLNTRLVCAKIKHFEVINLGVPGYDAKFAVERFRQKGVKYNPDLVVWLLIENDLSVIKELVERRIEEYGQTKLNLPKNVPVPLALFPGSFYNMSYQQSIVNLADEVGFENILNYQKAVLEVMRSLFNGKLLLYNLKAGGKLRSEYTDLLRTITKEQKDVFYYPSPIDLYAHDAVIVGDGHPNSFGHEMIAEDLLRYIVDTLGTDCTLTRDNL